MTSRTEAVGTTKKTGTTHFDTQSLLLAAFLRGRAQQYLHTGTELLVLPSALLQINLQYSIMRITVGSSMSLLSTFEHDVNLSAATKHECLKFLATILKNLSKDDPKYRQLRLGNAKIQRITSTHPSIMSYLQMLGFATVQEDGETLLRCAVPPANLASELGHVTAACERVAPAIISHSNSAASLTTEKQKARTLAEQKEAEEKEAARVARKRTVQQIKADQFVRQNDPNWKPSVSAAAAKSGDSMTTFRDKFGEN
jgi:PUB domain